MMKFHITYLLMYVRCDESSLYSRINYVHPRRETSLAGVSGIIKTMHTGFSVHVLHWRQRPGADTEETDVT